MDLNQKIDIKDFPSLNDVCIVPKNILNELIDYYKSNEYIKKHVQEAEEIVLDKRKSYTHEEMIAILKKEGL